MLSGKGKSNILQQRDCSPGYQEMQHQQQYVQPTYFNLTDNGPAPFIQYYGKQGRKDRESSNFNEQVELKNP